MQTPNKRRLDASERLRESQEEEEEDDDDLLGADVDMVLNPSGAGPSTAASSSAAKVRWAG